MLYRIVNSFRLSRIHPAKASYNSSYRTLPHLVCHSRAASARSTLTLLWVSAARSPVLRTILLSFVLAAAFTSLASAAIIAPLVRPHRYAHAHPHTLISHAQRRASHSHLDSLSHRANQHRMLESNRASVTRPATHSPADRRPRERRAKAGRSVSRPESGARAVPADDSASPSELVAAPRPVSYRRARRLVMPPPLTGSLASLERQNERSEAEGLERILDDDDLNDRIAMHFLVPVPASAALTINPDLPSKRRYCRPWTARFLTDFARAHAAVFHRPLEVSSAVRTVDYQKRLMQTNGNAAAAEGDIVSPHLTGATVDIAKHDLTLPELAWMRTRLLALELAGKIDVEEEFQQSCFHITVYKNYVAAPPKRRRIPPGTQLASRGQ
jgi:hypothetical protein